MHILSPVLPVIPYGIPASSHAQSNGLINIEHGGADSLAGKKSLNFQNGELKYGVKQGDPLAKLVQIILE